MLSRKISLSIIAVVCCILSVSIQAKQIFASDAYYTFGSNVSSNSGLRLLADKAADIGFPDRQSISFLKFAQSSLPSTTLGNKFKAILELDQDTSLASTLIPASSGRPVSLSIYNLTGVFDPINGNLADIDYGVNGANAIATTQISGSGIFRWDITSLVDSWITSPASNNGFALSGLFGNVDIDGRNSYGIFHTAGSTTGIAPNIFIPEPSIYAIFGIGLMGISVIGRRRRKLA